MRLEAEKKKKKKLAVKNFFFSPCQTSHLIWSVGVLGALFVVVVVVASSSVSIVVAAAATRVGAARVLRM
jgi:hypothetical protein